MDIQKLYESSENDPSEASIDVFEDIFYYTICGDIASQHRQKILKHTVGFIYSIRLTTTSLRHAFHSDRLS